MGIIHTVDELSGVVNNFLDEALLGQVSDDHSRQRSVDLQAFDKDGLGDESEGRDILEDTIVGRLVENDGVLCLILDFSFGPLLFLGGLAAR